MEPEAGSKHRNLNGLFLSNDEKVVNMPKPMIYVTHTMPEIAIKRLAEVFETRIHDEPSPPDKDEICTNIADADAILCLLTDTMDKEVIDKAGKLKVISNYAVGFNNIDVKYATQKGIIVCNTPGVLTETTADLTWALILACSRRIVESDRFVREGKFTGWEPTLFLGQDVFGKTLGIIGFGRIGQAVAKRAMGFGMRVIVAQHDTRSSNQITEYEPVTLDYLCRNADYISLHVPLTEHTHHLIGENELSAMKSTAVIINTSRGQIIDEKALIVALRERRIFAAGLDVYEKEPNIPPDLLSLPNVVLLPHIGSASVETRTKMALLAAENAIAVIEGRQPPAGVNLST
jgi:glyoxylate reductase